jgi:hypothetical protein
VKKPVDAAYHFFVVYEVAAVGCCDAPVHAFDKLRLPLEHTRNGFLHHLRGGFTFAGGELVKLRLCIGSEMNFHSQGYEQP